MDTYVCKTIDVLWGEVEGVNWNGRQREHF
jgi:hypothetical protein